MDTMVIYLVGLLCAAIICIFVEIFPKESYKNMGIILMIGTVGYLILIKMNTIVILLAEIASKIS